MNSKRPRAGPELNMRATSRNPFRLAVLFVCQMLLLCAVATAAYASDAAGSFDVLEYRVSGNSRLPVASIEKAVYPFLGPARTIANVESARQALERAYRDAGLPTVLVDIPEQSVSSGIVRLSVTEGRISRVRITGTRYFAHGWIRDQLPEIAAGRVPRLADFNRQLATFNARSGDRSVTPVLRPGAAPGTAEIELKVVDQLPVHGSLEVSNEQTISTVSDTRLSAAFRYGNLWQRDHSMGIAYQTAIEQANDFSSLSGNYSWHADRSTSLYRLSIAHVESATVPIAGGQLGLPGTSSKATIISGELSRPLNADTSGAPGRLAQSGSLGLEYRDYDDTLFCAPDCIEAPLRYARLTARWAGALATGEVTQSFGASLSLGARGFGSDADEIEFTRFASRANFAYLQLQYARRQVLPRGLSTSWSVSAQISPDAVITKEQFAAGGTSSVRGYFESEVLGDYGAVTSLELASPDFGTHLSTALEELEFYGFTDWAVLGLHDTLPGEDDGSVIGSMGLGLRLTMAAARAGLLWAWPYRDGAPRFPVVDPDANQSTLAGDDRVLFFVQSGF